ncbi:homeobox-leucine zipper protein ROC8-like [Impatiens glandulifera]|uniref:homeobox-leucine zipper protein ROC8-like n=1 Tax=Impatiens glandulifera TaxID=253017 RepID=UPI001FB12EED|nr:homeobox-leucine zipper protein ROC8-like [Impatiens glandulifera]
MDFGYGGNLNDFGDEQEHFVDGRGKKQYHRHTSHQIQRLEAFFKECPHPDENQRRHLSRELGLESKQIKFWFQNKRTQTKAHNERADNSSLRAENEKMQCENLAIREALKNVICPACGGPPFGEEERQINLQKLKNENLQLRQQYEKMIYFVSNFLGKPVGQVQTLSRLVDSQSQVDSPLGQGIMRGPSPGLAIGNSSNATTPCQLNGTGEVERSEMIETALNAMSELIRLLRVNEPVWIKSNIDGRYVLHQESYDKIFPRSNHFRTSTTRTESSKDSSVVAMNAKYLVEIFLDMNKWENIFATIVTKANIIEVLDSLVSGDKNCSLQLMYEQIHILSPLIAAREFYLLRYCKEIEQGLWVITDVSYDCVKDNNQLSSLKCWKLPSGCMIRDMCDGNSEVTWVEHVEVDDRSLTHSLYKDLFCGGGAAYGAPRWVNTLERVCERLGCASSTNSLGLDHEGGVMNVPEGRRSLMNLSHRMVKSFWAILSMTGKMDIPQLTELNNNNSGVVRVSVRHSEGPGQPGGMIVSAATSLWLPIPCETLFNYLRDENKRTEWDLLSDGNPVNEIARISCGSSHPGNRISVLQALNPKESQMMMLQESCIDSSGAVIVYGPIDLPAIKSVINGDDSSHIPILPSGFTICGDNRPDKTSNGASTSSSSSSSSNSRSATGGSFLTVAFQILVCNNLPNNTKQLNMESVATANTLVTSTVQKIKFAFNCPDHHDD